jgi:hypothetical protein
VNQTPAAASVNGRRNRTRLIPFDGSLRVKEWGRKESHTTDTEEDTMKFQKSISNLAGIAVIAILTLSVISANAQSWRPGGMQAIRPGGAGQIARVGQTASVTVPISGPWPERFASFFHWLY